MSNDPEKVIALASKITTMAEGALSGLDRVICGWPAEFRAIMWEAVADIATRRAISARMKETARTPARSPKP